MEAKVSIIVPVYNHEKYIYECISSIIGQTYENWEAIIIDDGSSDDSVLLIEDLIGSDDRFIFKKQKNQGIYELSKLYNDALYISSGSLVAVLEGDDFWPLDKLEKQVPCFKNHDIGLCWGGGVYVDSDSLELGRVIGQLGIWGVDVCFNNPIGNSLKYLLFDTGFFNMPTCSVMYRKDDLLSIGGFVQPEGLKWLDKPTWIRLSLESRFYYIDEVVGYWRRHKNQITAINNEILSTVDYMRKDKIWQELMQFEEFSQYDSYFDIHTRVIKIYRLFQQMKIVNIRFLKAASYLFFKPISLIKYLNFKKSLES